jgi:hypothetical protein
MPRKGILAVRMFYVSFSVENIQIFPFLPITTQAEPGGEEGGSRRGGVLVPGAEIWKSRSMQQTRGR